VAVALVSGVSVEPGLAGAAVVEKEACTGVLGRRWRCERRWVAEL
jgi:hypothetical protein